MNRKENVLAKKSFAFSKRIVKLYQYLHQEKKDFVLSKQILKSGTSIGANVAEANGAISNHDFSAKISISYKESLETKLFDSLYTDCDELSKILFAILKTTRINDK
jgi:hypothetical protein